MSMDNGYTCDACERIRARQATTPTIQNVAEVCPKCFQLWKNGVPVDHRPGWGSTESGLRPNSKVETTTEPKADALDKSAGFVGGLLGCLIPLALALAALSGAIWVIAWFWTHLPRA